MAVVGDASLAATSPAIVLQLYKEHPQVVAMTSAEVQQLHEERRTTVEGADIKPLRSFAQLGLPAPSGTMLSLLVGATVAAVVAGSATTAYKLAAKKMTPQ